MYNFNDALYTYFISDGVNPVFECQEKLFDTGLILNYTKKTDVYMKSKGNSSVCIIGLCIDSHGEIERESIPEFLLDNGDGINNVITASKRLAGKFVIIIRIDSEMYIFNDATGALQVYYTTDRDICIASYSEFIGKHYNLSPSDEAMDIIKKSSYSHTLPYDMSFYSNVKLLLPDYYLSVYKRTATRFYPCGKIKKVNRDEVYGIVKKHISLTRNILREYGKYRKFTCALSSGWDSRTDLAFMSEYDKTIPCFTYKLNGFNEKTDDVFIPPILCDAVNMEHKYVEMLEPPEEYIKEFEEKCGKYHIVSTINLVYNYRNSFPDRVLIEGQVIDPIATMHIGYKLPVMYATTSFLVAKLHNYSRYARKWSKKYLEDIKKASSFSEIYDIFALEIRLGQWRGFAETTYSLSGVDSLNLFNCREIVEDYFILPKELKTEKIVHKIIMGELNPELLDIPFNPSHKLGSMTKNQYYF